jgi:hypothetical protein
VPRQFDAQVLGKRFRAVAVFAAVYGATPWDLPADVGLGLMMNLTTACAWKALPVMHGVGLSFTDPAGRLSFFESLRGQNAGIKERIRASFEELRSKKWPST